jgi:hypothetical protein
MTPLVHRLEMAEQLSSVRCLHRDKAIRHYEKLKTTTSGRGGPPPNPLRRARRSELARGPRGSGGEGLLALPYEGRNLLRVNRSLKNSWPILTELDCSIEETLD